MPPGINERFVQPMNFIASAQCEKNETWQKIDRQSDQKTDTRPEDWHQSISYENDTKVGD
mgnify:CR=1 FL=1